MPKKPSKVPPHLQPITCRSDKYNGSFNLFQKLPLEVRFLIWQHYLSGQERIIRVHPHSWFYPLLASGIMVTQQHILGHNQQKFETHFRALPPPAAYLSDHYELVVEEPQYTTSLLQVNSESRFVALKFYRVQVPCILWRKPRMNRKTALNFRPGKTVQPGVLYFNPENDILQICDNNTLVHDVSVLPHLYYDFKKRDPKNVGVLNLAMDSDVILLHLKAEAHQSDLEIVQKTLAFKKTIADLKQLFFVQEMTEGYLNSPSYMRLQHFSYNRSFPIKPTEAPNSTFFRLKQDPRPISKDLKRVYLQSRWGIDTMVQDWRQLLTKWDILPTELSHRETEYRHLVCSTINHPNTTRHYGIMYDRPSGLETLNRLENTWLNTFKQTAGKDPKNSEKPLAYDPIQKNAEKPDMPQEYQDEDLDKVARPAFGFWLFHLDTKIRLNEPDEMYDMSNDWPELGLYSFH
jgi:hypothetical protein